MGAGKEKQATWQRQQPLSKALPQARFNLVAIGTRMSPSAIFSEEISYWSDHSEQAARAGVPRPPDDDFGWIVLARDRIGRFRCVDLKTDLRSAEFAARGVRQRVAEALDGAAPATTADLTA